MSDRIRLSPKHGVNPAVEKCFWCDKDRGVVLFGKMRGDMKAPSEVIMSYEPCEGCAVWAHSRDGCFFVECDEVNGKPHPTGRFCCVKDAAVQRLGLDPAIVERIIATRIARVKPEMYEFLGLAEASDA